MTIHNVRETLIQATRAWLKEVLGDEFTLLNYTPDGRVIVEARADDPESQPPSPLSPYIVVNVPVYNRPISRKHDEYLVQGVELAEPVRQRTRDYSAIVRLFGVGSETSAWLSLLAMEQDRFNSDVATLYDCSEVQDVAVPNEKGLLESRFILDLRLEYSLGHEVPQTPASNYTNTGNQP